MVRGRARPWAVFALGMAVLFLAAALRLLGPLNAGLLRLRHDFRPASPFSLFDSLPALSPGLSNLEAFSISLPPGTPANADRSLWLADRVDSVKFAFHSGRRPFDSVELYLWAGESLRRTTIRQRGSQDWSIPLQFPVPGWTEIVGFTLSHPPLFRVRARDPSVEPFTRLEGGILHVIGNAYARPPEGAAPPDTAYAAPGAGELALLAREGALAIVNPSRRPVRLRLLHAETGSRTLHLVPAGRVHVHREILHRTGTTLAHTEAAEPLCLLGTCRESRAEFFGLQR